MTGPGCLRCAEDEDAALLLADQLRRGERRAVAAALTLLEQTGPKSARRTARLLEMIQPDLKGVAVVGFTGPPGAGKSTLVNALIRSWRARDLRLGVIAVDPSSPVSGGAILGDRIRMTAGLDDDGVFIRSLASQGHLGGLSPAAVRMIDAFDVAGYDLVLLETVGTGQNEIDIAAVADVGVVIVAPGLGDGIQAMKSGLLEIADVLVVNKADRPQARETAQQLHAAISLREGIGRTPEILETIATTGCGVEALANQIDALVARQRETHLPAARRLRRGRYIIERLAIERIRSQLDNSADAHVTALIEAVLTGALAPREAVAELFTRRC